MEDYMKDLWDNARRLTTRLCLIWFVFATSEKLDPELSYIRGNSRGTAPRVSRRSSFQSSANLEHRRNGGLFEGFVGHRTSGDEEKTAVPRRSPLEPDAHPLHSPNGGLFEGLVRQCTPAVYSIISNKVFFVHFRDPFFNRNLFDEIVEELRQEYHRAVLSNQVPILCILLMEDYLKDLWDNARRLTTRLYLIWFFSPFQRNLTLNLALFEEIVDWLVGWLVGL
ncbi:hypothetical protein CEXT_63551 [Caerostris extrusa]|uniref:Uncharacterized protein n=1 Tax=Caerostris extrusa TaxID=172846 RepID=A0AAV4MGL6_CAEEX|nr:hypothetical protein CEXT_63551 [Caerostris extrusa]